MLGQKFFVRHGVIFTSKIHKSPHLKYLGDWKNSKLQLKQLPIVESVERENPHNTGRS